MFDCSLRRRARKEKRGRPEDSLIPRERCSAAFADRLRVNPLSLYIYIRYIHSYIYLYALPVPLQPEEKRNEGEERPSPSDSLTPRGRCSAAFADGQPLIMGTIVSDGYLANLSLAEVRSLGIT